MLEVFLISTIVVLFTFLYLKSVLSEFLKYKKLFTNVQGPKTLPLSLIAFAFTFRSDSSRFEILQRLSQIYPNYFSLWFGPKYLFITDDPIITQKLLTTPECVEKNFFMDIFGFPNGLIAMKANKWKNERKLLNHTFASKILKKFLSEFEASAKDGVNTLSTARKNGENIQLDQHMSVITMNAVLRTTLGFPVSPEITTQITYLTERLCELIWSRSMNPMLYCDYIYSFTKSKRMESKIREEMFNLIQDTIQRMETCLKDFLEESFLNQLIVTSNNGRLFSDDEINDHVGTMIVAGGETTSTALSFFFLMLAMHPNVQHYVRNEIDEIFGSEIKLTFDNLSKMKYLDMVIKETLRLFNPTLGLIREVKETVDLGIDGIKLPKGTNLIVNVHSLHRRKDIWGERSETFNPDNFLAENISARHAYSYVPFSNGTRVCIGNRYATMLMKVIAVYYTRNFRFETSMKFEDIKRSIGITIKLQGKYPVEVVNI